LPAQLLRHLLVLSLILERGLYYAMPSKLTNEEYDKKLAKFGKACRLEPYVNQHARILHRCLIHGEEWLAIPGDLALGHGMKCCGKVLNNKAKAAYDSKLAAIGLAERVEPYISRRVAIQHRCLRHGKLFSQEPRRALEGRIPPCCGGMWRGSLYSMLIEPKRWGLGGHSVVYLFRLARFRDHVKIGISANTGTRADSEYGDFICYWTTQSRFHAFLIEQASLADGGLTINCPEELRSVSWPGWTEVRKVDSNKAVQIVQFYCDVLEQIGPYQFILDYLNPTDIEKELCLQRLAESADGSD